VSAAELLTRITPDSAHKLRAVFECANYAEFTILKLLAAPDWPTPRQRSQALPLHLRRCRGGTPLELLVRLFHLHQTLPIDDARRAVAPTALEDWTASGLLSADPTAVRAAFEVTPYQGLLLASDWFDADTVDPVMGVAATSRALVRLTVRRRAGRALDLGTGSGVQALLAARHSDHVCGTDLNARAVQLARCNAVLNGLTNVEFLSGDLFEPVREQRFDLIVCNPPFVIGPGRGELHTHSGRPSDELCRDIIRTAPAFLNEGGYFQLVGNWAEVAGQDWRERLASWFTGSGCDAWVLRSHREDAVHYAHQRVTETVEGPEAAARRFEEWAASFEQERIEGVGYGLITLRRRSGGANWQRFDPLPPLPDPSGQVGSAIERGFALRDFLEAHRNDRDLLAARLRHAPKLSWERRFEASATGWAAVESRLRLTEGLAFAGNIEPAVAEFVVRCRGDRPLSAHLIEAAKAARQKPEQLQPGFLKVVRGLLELGLLLPVS
jgi:SAM-dependent methyltransferase